MSREPVRIRAVIPRVTRAVIDTDPGIDDALALLLAWASPEMTVDAITTVAGNVPVDIGTTNVFRLLALRPPRQRPVVAVGAAAPLARKLNTATRYHGETVTEGALVVNHGGKGANQAVAARRLGGDVRLIACVGDDDSGRGIAAALARDGVGVAGLAVSRAGATGTALIIVDADGR